MHVLRLLALAALIALGGFVPVHAQDKASKVFGAWQVECDPSQGSKCVLAFALVSAKDKKVAFAWSILPGKEKGTFSAVVRTLNGTLLPEGVVVTFAGQDPLRLAYRTCGPRFCFVEIPFTDSWLKAFKAQKSFNVSYKAVDGKEVKHDVSLDKFTQAYDFFTANLAKAQ